jgi:hypothetical protein
MSILDKISLGYSMFDDTIYLYRHGKDRKVALERKPFEKEVMAVLIEHMMSDAPKGSVKTVSFGEKSFEIIVRPVEK